MPTRRAVHNLWIVAERSEELSGKWEAHCLDLDLVAARDQLDEAVAAVLAQAHDMIIDDLKQRRCPSTRSAPEEDWTRMFRLLATSEEASMESMLEDAQSGEHFIAFIQRHLVVPIELTVIDGEGHNRPTTIVARRAEAC